MKHQRKQLNPPQNIVQLISELFSDKVVKLLDPPWSREESLPQECESDFRKTEVSESSSSWLEMLELGRSPYHIGAAVLDYCISNKNSRAFVFFSMENHLVTELIETLAETPNFHIIYAESLDLTKVGALNLIELCYGDKAFFTERVRKRMTRERFVFSTRAFVIFYELKDGIEEAIKLKAKLRNYLPTLTFERRIHGTDGVQDTRYLAEALTNPNSFSLINRVKVSRHDRVFSRLPASLRDNPNVCIDGSATMEVYGLRKSRDLDLICLGSSLEEEVLAMGSDVNNGPYRELPFSHEDVITSPYLHVSLFGTKVTSLATRQLILSFGPRAAGASWANKKTRDMRSIAGFILNRRSFEVDVTGHLSTMATQLRLIFEFVINRIMPQLPPGLAQTIRSIRQSLTSKSKSPHSGRTQN
jgi:hypothetical protein